MLSPTRIIAYVLIFVLTSMAWVALGGTMNSRTSGQSDRLGSEVQTLWGRPHLR